MAYDKINNLLLPPIPQSSPQGQRLSPFLFSALQWFPSYLLMNQGIKYTINPRQHLLIQYKGHLPPPTLHFLPTFAIYILFIV